MPWRGSEGTAKAMHPGVTTTQEVPLTPSEEIMGKDITLSEAILPLPPQDAYIGLPWSTKRQETTEMLAGPH